MLLYEIHINVTYMAIMKITKDMLDINKISKKQVKMGISMTFSDNDKHYLLCIVKSKKRRYLKAN